MKSKKALSAVSYPSRSFENYQVLNDSGCLVVCPKLSINDAVKQKNSETFVSSFFAFRHRSKVIFRVTQNSPADSFAFPRKPCSARLPTPPPAPDGCKRRGRLNRCLPLPMVAVFGHSVGAYPAAIRYACQHLPMVGVRLVLTITHRN